jgi:hypothetical protein
MTGRPGTGLRDKMLAGPTPATLLLQLIENKM